jgi:hypothetical protein
LHGLVPYTRADGNGNRCALGLINDGDDAAVGDYDNAAETQYPWIEGHAPQPCNCKKIDLCLIQENISGIIAHLFNEHVMKERDGGLFHPNAEPWTMERLADWINSVDPTPGEPELLTQTQSTATLKQLQEVFPR